MSVGLNPDELVSSRETREQHINRVDVLAKIKALSMLPGDTYATTEIVAGFYEVDVEVIRQVAVRNRDELTSDGFRTLRGTELRDMKSLAGIPAQAGAIAVFPRRAILRIGMLLRDSPVARQVRGYLLNAEAVATGMDLTNLDNVELIYQGLGAALARAKAEQQRAELAEKTVAVMTPKVQYVDRYTNPNDATTIRVCAAQLEVDEKKLKAWLIDNRIIYRREVGRRWSKSQYRWVEDYEWLPYAAHKAWFTLKDQAMAPRMHNGQLRTTLYVTPAGKTAIGNLLKRKPLDGN